MNRGIEDLTDKIQAILAEEDVEGLIEIGAPTDEYHPESVELAKVIDERKQTGELRLSDEDCQKLIVDTWTRMFGPLSEDQIRLRHAAFERIARKITRSV